MTRNYYCKGYRLRMRRILGTASLCLLLAAMTGAALHYHQYDRSEELALERARTELLSQQLKLRQFQLVKTKKEPSVQTSSSIITVSMADKLLQGGMLSQSYPYRTNCRRLIQVNDAQVLRSTIRLGTPGKSSEPHFTVGLLQVDEAAAKAAERRSRCVK